MKNERVIVEIDSGLYYNLIHQQQNADMAWTDVTKLYGIHENRLEFMIADMLKREIKFDNLLGWVILHAR